ncbi:MAG TPA: HD-GYP domain-containing protein [Actinomycetota bacterium]
MEEPSARTRRWRARPILAAGLRILVLIVPALLALAVTASVHPFIPLPRTWPGRMAWWCGLLGLGLIVATVVERLVRRMLPLVMLLKLAMLFPDRAPSRFAVAREAGSVRRLRSRLAALDADPDAEQETLSAERILALAMALQSHDRRTRGHSERVRVFTDLLAEEMKLPPEDRDRLRWSALLHDIGKLTVAARILNKPGKLDEHEWDVIRGHPAEGARIAGPLLEWLGPWAGAIAEHHERFDGRGYPAELAAHDISLGGRIVAVADCYDTMTAARSYKRPMAVVAARAELARCAGSQFDPTAVRAFLGISIPRLLWKTGPLSFLVQLPFLWRLQKIAQQGLSVAAQGVTAATVAAGIAAITATGPAAASPAPPAPRNSVPIVTVAPSPSPSPSPSGTKQGGTGKRKGGTRPSSKPTPSPTPTATTDPLTDPVKDLTDPLTDPLTDLTDPLPSISPLPLPSVPLPSLPLPTPKLP